RSPVVGRGVGQRSAASTACGEHSLPGPQVARTTACQDHSLPGPQLARTTALTKGDTMIRRLLGANRGEIARRIFATCRAVGVETVAVYSDADAGAPHTREADYAVHLPGNAPSATYLRGDLLIDAAHRSGA